MEIDKTLKALQLICAEVDLKPSDDMLLDCAVRIYNTKRINGQGDGATDKQVATMEKLNIDFNKDISKKEASDLIGKKIDSFK